jgi:ferredoxin
MRRSPSAAPNDPASGVHGARRAVAVVRLAFRRRQQEHWNVVRKSCRGAGHAPTLASRVVVMRVHLDAEKCQGHNRCYALAPELFDVDDYGQAMLLVEGDVPEELQDKARLAASNCPEYAITITENG